MAPDSKTEKHYTAMDKKVFLEILKEYKDIVEQKKSDGVSLRDKGAAWTAIAAKFNGALHISETRTVPQLKKLWSNMKQVQRDALIKEKQARMATGGGPEVADAEIDPDIAAIAPHLMTLSPVLYSSNITEAEQQIAIDSMNDTLQDDENSQLKYEDIEYLMDETISEPPTTTTIGVPSTEGTPIQTRKKMCVAQKRTRLESSSHSQTPTSASTAKCIAQSTIHELGIQRLKILMEQDKEMFEMKRNHISNIQELEVRKTIAEVELAELLLERERNKS